MQWSPPGTCGGETVKRTPVLVDVHGTPLRESLGYTGGGIGFGGQMADWMPPAESVDAALLPSLRLGNARADDLVRNNGIAANAVALHKDHIVGHLFLISYRPNWRYLGMRESAAKSFVDEVEAAWTEYCDGIFGEMDAEGKRTFTEFIREAWAFTPLMVKFFSSLSGTLKPRRFSVPDSRLSVRNGWTHRGMPAETASFAQEWKRTGMEKPSPIMSVMMTGRWLVGNAGPVFLVFCRPDDPRCYIFSSRLRTDRRAVPISFTV